MSEPREIEAKFDVDQQGRDRLLTATAVGRFSIQDRRTAVQDDIYFDTDDASLAAAGSTLRIRRTSTGSRMTFKGRREAGAPDDEAHIASRLEDEVPLENGQTSAVRIDAPLLKMEGVSPFDRARAIIGNRALHPVARLQNTRTTLLLSNGGTLLELAIDDCVGTRLSDGREIRFDEVELETKSADRAALLEASSALRALAPSLRPSRLTKLGRTLG